MASLRDDGKLSAAAVEMNKQNRGASSEGAQEHGVRVAQDLRGAR